MKTAEIEAAVQSYLSKMTPEQLAKSNAYFEGGYWIQLWSFLLGLLLAWILLRSGFSAKIRDRVEGWTKSRFLKDCLYIAGYVILTSIVTFPFSVYTDFFREHQYALSNQTFGAWFLDYLKSGGIGLILATFFLAAIYKLVRRFEKTWWIWASAAAFVFCCFVIMIVPVFISPLFNTYKPLSPGPIRDSVLAMAHSNGIPADEVWEFDASRQSNRVSANVSGIFGTTRISLNDNLLKRCSEAEIRAVMGHEIGHYVMNHGLKSMMMISLLWMFGFGLIYRSLGLLIRKNGVRWRVSNPGDIAGLPLFVAIFSVFMFLATPIFNTIIRTHEIEADMFGLNLAGEPDGESEVALKLSEYRKMTPSKFEEFIFFDHPSGENRIRASMTWKAYAKGAAGFR
ncbi:MAG: M48 family metallopeptidase [Bdellovibrionales bacterium]